MQTKDTVTGWTVGLLALQILCQGACTTLVAFFPFDAYDDTVQTFDTLAMTPLTSVLVLLTMGFGIFRTLRLSLILTLIMLLPWIDGAFALGQDANHWDPDIQGDITSADQALLYLNIARYACYALIAILSALAVRRALQKMRRHAAAG